MEAVAKLKNDDASPRKMRRVANLIRGKQISYALNILKFQPQANAPKLEKLVRSAVANWEQANPEKSIEEANLYIKTIFVDGGRALKRVRPAPQGRAYRIQKRSNHVTIIVDSLPTTTINQAVAQTENE